MKIKGIEITNPDKIVFENGKISKSEVINYYNDIAPFMLKSLKNRPITAYRCHGGIEGECFFKKHPMDYEDVGKIMVDESEYFYISTSKELILEAQLGTIEFHTWGCKIDDIERPDVMIFDLDPAEDVSIKRLREGVINLKSILDELNLKNSLKTSGGKGYHISVPLKRGKSWEDVGNLALQISNLLQAKWPNLFTTNIRKDKRSKKIFVDYLRNKKGASCVAAYSLRARKNAPISFPIKWSDLNNILPNEINIKNYKDFLPRD